MGGRLSSMPRPEPKRRSSDGFFSSSAFFAAALVSVLVATGLGIALAYVAVHFIAKWW